MQSQKSYESMSGPALYLVPTPIGNLEDITFRALTVLKEVDWIGCEDTRHSLKLLNHFDIENTLVSYHEYNKESRIPQLIKKMLDGERGALISDAGTPIISDPGYELVRACIDQSIPVIPLAGANAATTALIASGLVAQPYSFYGFLPHQAKDRKQALGQVKDKTETLIFYESPHRLKKMLRDARQVFGGDRLIAIARELTKQYEEIVRGTLEEAVEWADQEDLRGEFCLVIEGASSNQTALDSSVPYISYADHVRLLEESQAMSAKEAIKEVAKKHGVAKRFVYNEYHDL